MAMSDTCTPELEAIKRCAPDLESALKNTDRKLVYFLNQEGFINDDDCDEILDQRSMLTAAQKAGKLVKSIKNRVKQDAKSFHVLLDRFKQDGTLYGPIIKKLTSNYYPTIVGENTYRSPLSSSLLTPYPSHHQEEDSGEFHLS